MTVPEIEKDLQVKQEQIEELRMQLHSTVKDLGELRDQLGLDRPGQLSAVPACAAPGRR